MGKIYILNQKLEDLQSLKKTFPSIDNMSILQFAKYKKILHNEEKITNKIYKLNLLKKEVNFLYDINTKSWIANPKINCRTYYKLEQKALYKKNLTLYKIGVLSEKPKHPVVQNISTFITTILTNIKSTYANIEKYLNKKFFSKFTLFKRLNQKYDFLISNTLPRKINNLAINTAKLGIKGYKQLETNCRFIKNSIDSKQSYRYVKSIINEANKQISKGYDFRESLRINPNDLRTMDNNNSVNTSKSLVKSNASKHPEYIL